METNKIISVHQAFYGIVNQSHSCIHSTLKDPGLNAFLTGFTDRPGPVPAGIKMEPYYSATAHGNYYIFTLTFPDYDAKRPGMVFTHALILSISDLKKLNNLDELFNEFVTNIPEIKNKLEVLSFLQPTFNPPKTFQAFIPLAVEKLLSGQLPVIFCGKTNSFLKLIKAVWAGVPSSLRSKFAYTVGFSGASIDESKTFIHFQSDLKSQLNNKDFISDEFDHAIEITSIAQKYLLLGDKDNGLNQFMEDLKVDLNDWSTIQIAARAFDAYQIFSDLSNDPLKQLIRQIAKISPRPEDGEHIKEKIIAELKNRLIDRSEQNLKSLKNMPLQSYHSGEKQLQDAMVLFFEREFGEENNFNVELISELALNIQNAEKNWWYKGTKDGLSKIASFTNITQLKNVWKTLIQSKESLSAISLYLPPQENYENSLLKTMPDEIPEKTAKILAEKFRIKKWYLLHAHLLQTYLTPKEALRQQFSTEQSDKVTSFRGTEAILTKVSDSDLLELALKTKEDYFINTYIDRAVSKSALLNDLKTDDPVWLHIWSGSIEKTKILTHGITNPSEKIEQVLTALSEDVIIPTTLIQAISESKFADISNHKHRPLIWGKLPLEFKVKILKATADSILNTFNDLNIDNVEQDLRNYMMGDEYILLFMKEHTTDIDSVMHAFEQINSNKDNFLANYIRQYQQIDTIQATRLGSLINQRKFTNTANVIYDKASKNNPWKFALIECYHLLDLLTRMTLKISGILTVVNITDDQWWKSTEDLIVEFYPNSISLTTIWRNVGGKESELLVKGTSSEIWSDVFYKLRKDHFKEITMNDLLKEVKKQYGDNQKFKIIYDLRKNYIKT